VEHVRLLDDHSFDVAVLQSIDKFANRITKDFVLTIGQERRWKAA
jgi:hypothetical protein